MTRKEVKNLLPILQAFAEGRVIQYRDNGVWKDITTEDGFFTENAFVNVNDYRIKPKPTYRPFANAEECWEEMQKHQPFGWVIKKANGRAYNIQSILFRENNLYIRSSYVDLVKSFNEYTFTDGATFGVKVEKEN